ncbi:MAG: hypothetical protein A2787_00500 [Omnitrophica WOR_2 bacterium RIFCSPHIGHO2_01_FULL_48_9]|nr:MAG: hypothetical protein A2787_00500 [Omnitrophica WOR_2 bacterium RIFCSPHIGHO2_01_FULL_48_9]
MRKRLLLPFFILLTGCATMQATNIPGQTSASLTLKADILNMINMIENAQAPGCSHKVVDTKFIGTTGNSVNEEWIVESCGKQISYPVTLTPDPKGGTYFGVKTPEKGVR